MGKEELIGPRGPEKPLPGMKKKTEARPEEFEKKIDSSEAKPHASGLFPIKTTQDYEKCLESPRSGTRNAPKSSRKPRANAKDAEGQWTRT